MNSIQEALIVALGLLLAFVAGLWISGAEAQQSVLPGYQVCSTASGSTQCSFQPISAANPLPVTTSGGGGGAATIANGADVAEGSTTDSPATTPTTGTAATTIALLKALNNSNIAPVPAGTNLIGHVITDTGSVTNATLSAETTKVIGTINQGTSPWVTSGTSTVSGTVSATQGTSPWITAGGGTAGSAAAGVTTVQGIASMTPVQVSQATAASLNATVVGTGTFATQATLAAETTKVIGTVNQGTSPWVTSGTSTVSGTITANQGTSPWVNNTSQINGVTPLMGNGVTGTGSQRVTIASDNTAFPVNAATQGAVNITLTDCSGTIATGATAQNAFTAASTRHGFTIANIDTTEVLWISFTTTAAASGAGSYPLAPASATTFSGLVSFTSPVGMGINTALSVIAATTAHKFSCTVW